MSSSDGNYHVVFNGEIYNFVELREELVQKGVRFRSNSDTEVLLELWAAMGPACLPKLTGMFTFCLFDLHRRRLILARDSFGIKPLYLAQWADGWAVCSEVPPLLELPGIDRTLDANSVFRFLAYTLTDQAGSTMLQGVKQVRPGTFMEIDIDWCTVVHEEIFWQLNSDEPAPGADFDTEAQSLRELFLQSVRLHLRSDVPVGAALSGGLDSSAIVCAMRYLEPSLDIHTFTFVSPDPRRSEKHWAEIVSKHVHAIEHHIELDESDFAQDCIDLFKAQFEPFSDLSIYAQYKVFQRVREEGIKVVLDGQGADELFGGYGIFVAYALLDRLQHGEIQSAARLLNAARHLPENNLVLLLLRMARGVLPQRGSVNVQHRLRLGLLPAGMDLDWFKMRDACAGDPCGQQLELEQEDRRPVDGERIASPASVRRPQFDALFVESRVPFLDARPGGVLRASA